MLIKTKKLTDLPFEEGKIYQTKFATKETFLLKEILWKESKSEGRKMFLFRGIYQNSQHLGICSINIDRLIPETIEDGEMEVCSKCGTPA